MKLSSLFSIFCAFFMFIGMSMAQDICPPALRASEGTYELISLTKIEEVFTTDILCEIESRRHDDKNVDWQISEFTVVTIFSKKVVSSMTFSE